MPPPTFHIATFGCQMNKLDSELLGADLQRRGLQPVDEPGRADVLIVNTCSVRRHAEEKVYSWTGRFKPRAGQPRRIVGIVGCMGRNHREAVFERLPFVDFVSGPASLHRVGKTVEHLLAGGAADEPAPTAPPPERVLLEAEGAAAAWLPRQVARRPDPFRAFVAVNRGCNNFCAYCIVPYTRGREISRPMDDIVEEVRRLVDDGVLEVTLLGQNVNSWGQDFDRARRFSELVSRLDRIEGLARLRFVTSHPKDLADDLIDAMADCPTVCENLHLPPQSGSNRILEAMNRKYTREHYLERVDRLKESVPGITLAGDFIVGFPGETEADYLATRELVERVRYKTAFVFKYSPREGTAAARLPDDVPVGEKKRRNRDLLDVQESIATEDNARLIGSREEILVEGPSKRFDRYVGRTRTDRIVHIPGDDTLTGRLVGVRLLESSPLSFVGEAIDAGQATA
jgi:tRNA-2-methylthio-N6-dimethylallyladenosine synthase